MEEQKHPNIDGPVSSPATHIVPSVGRVVWYWPNPNEEYVCIEDDQPMRADVCHVNSDGTINLSVNDHAGNQIRRHGITLHQGDAAGCSLPRPFATWMPYQKGQAAKTEAAEQRAVDAMAEAHAMEPPAFDAMTEEVALDLGSFDSIFILRARRGREEKTAAVRFGEYGSRLRTKDEARAAAVKELAKAFNEQQGTA